MNTPILIAAVLCALLGVIHSVLGERLIFARLHAHRRGEGPHVLSAQRIRVLRATWHLVSLLALSLAAVLWLLAQPDAAGLANDLTIILLGTFLLAGLYWLLATRGRHPAWVVLLLIAGLLGGFALDGLFWSQIANR